MNPPGNSSDELISIFFHELKAPLSIILSSAELLKLHITSSIPSDSSLKYIQYIEQNSHHLLQMINSALEYLRADTVSGDVTDVSFEPCDLRSLTEQLLCNIQPYASFCHTSIYFQCDTNQPFHIHCSKIHIERILLNLLCNALRHTPSGGKIFVSLEHSETSNLLRVSDTGEGISPELLPHIFERFRRGNHDSAGTSLLTGTGSGLGLYIVKQAVELHGGTVTATNIPGSGAAFTVTLPLFDIPNR